MKKLLLAAALFCAGCGQGFDYSDGSRVGTVVKFSKKGAFCKTWEGEMVLGGVRASENGAIANVWAFSVIDEKVVHAVQQAAEDGRRVKLTYHEGLLTGPCISETSYFVTAAESVGQ